MDGYEPQTLTVDVAAGDVADRRRRRRAVDVALRRDGHRTGRGAARRGHLVGRSPSWSSARTRQVITDNLGAQEMKTERRLRRRRRHVARDRACRWSTTSTCSSAASASATATPRWTASVLPTTEPDKKVVPLDLFPAGLLDSVQVIKSYSPDRSAEFAGGLVQIDAAEVPAAARCVDFSYGLQRATRRPPASRSRSSPLGTPRLARASTTARARCPAGIPDDKIVRRGIYTPDGGLHARRDHGLRPAARRTSGARGRRRRARPELGRACSATASASSASSPA